MAIEYLAYFQRERFEAFKRLLGSGLPDTYDAWFRFQADRRQQIVRNGLWALGVEVDPDEFVAWIVANGREPSANVLDEFASFEGGRI